ncbi:MAG: MlaD family protein [Pseudomonadales bacterium]|jgi:paraquat-inducible protein B|nr:MlaD family protein [Pseudomonadales bacterium]
MSSPENNSSTNNSSTNNGSANQNSETKISEQNGAAPARIRRPRRISGLWLIPLVTLLVALGMAFDNYRGRGPLVTIHFKSGAGIEAGRTLIKTLDVEVGQVEDVTLNDTLDGVIVTARIHGNFRGLLAENSRFWVVQPIVSLAGVSGLNTLISGQYIEFAPGGARRMSSEFTGLDKPPLTPIGTPGLRITLVADGDFSFAEGDHVHYQGRDVGQIEDVRYDFEDGRTYYDAFIEAPFHELIVPQTRFWKTSGVQAELTSDGVRLETGTLDSLLSGGVSFANPPGVTLSDTVNVQTEFYVYGSRAEIEDHQYQQSLRYWIMVSDSVGVGGLSEDSRVMYRGLPVGRVVDTDNIPEGRNLLDRSLQLPILIEIQPARLGLPDTSDGAARARADIENWIRAGLTATIGSRNFLVGQQQVELQYQNNIARDELDYFDGLAIIPTDHGSISRFTNSIEALLVKLNELPVENALDGISELTRQAATSLEQMQSLLESTQDLMASERSTALVGQLDATLSALQTLADTYSAESSATRDIQRTLNAVTDLMNEFRPLAEELRQRPSRLLFSEPPPAEAQPVRKQP